MVGSSAHALEYSKMANSLINCMNMLQRDVAMRSECSWHGTNESEREREGDGNREIVRASGYEIV